MQFLSAYRIANDDVETTERLLRFLYTAGAVCHDTSVLNES